MAASKAGLVLVDLPRRRVTKPGLSPWLAGIYVRDAFRRAGVGALLVRALESKAKVLDVETLYLSVGAARGFDERLGWAALERVTSFGVKKVTLMSKRPVRRLIERT